MRTHVDLFSGIGGFALAARWAGVETIAFAEIDPYASRVLERHFSGVRNYGRVQDVPAMDAWLVTGGVPCQPASIAGQRRGADDDRWLWPEAIAAVERFKPTWVCLENPLGILSLEKPIMSLDLEGYGNLVEAAISSEGDFWANITGEVGIIFRDLISSVEELGYEVSPVVIPACGLGAWHRRYRVWIMGHATGVQPRAEQQSTRANVVGLSGAESLPDSESVSGELRQTTRERSRRLTSKSVTTDTNGRRTYSESQRVSKREGKANASGNGSLRSISDTAGEQDIERERGELAQTLRNGRRGTRTAPTGTQHPAAECHSWWASEPNVGRVVDGLPSRLDRLRTLGNAIVPQVAYQLIKRMIEAEESTKAA